MSDYKRQNSKLALVLVALLVIIMVLINIGNHDKDFDRSILRIENTAQIDKVVYTSETDSNQISFDGENWRINSKYQVDPMKIRLLFAAVNQISIRRQLDAESEISIIENLGEGYLIEFYSNNNRIRQFKVWGDSSTSLTYIMHDEVLYLVEIPGYKTFISGHLKMEETEWRHANIFHEMAWRNLSRINIKYPEEPERDFGIVMGRDFFRIEGLEATDTTKLVDFVDHLSLIDVDEYINEEAFPDSLVTFQIIEVYDVGNNLFKLELLTKESQTGLVFGSLNREILFRLSGDKIAPLNKSKNYFKP